MRTDTSNFAEKNLSDTKEPRYTIQISFDSGNTVLYYFTSHSDSAVPSGAESSTYYSVIKNISGTTQGLSPVRANSTIGSISFSVVDIDQGIRDLLNTQDGIGRSLRKRRVRIYVGYLDLDWDDYSLVATQFIDEFSNKDNVYKFKCADIQREERKEIFDLAETNITSDVDISIRYGDTWQVTTVYDLNDEVKPPTPNGYSYIVTIAGTSGSSPLSWPTTPGDTVDDGTVVWTNNGTTTVSVSSTSDFEMMYHGASFSDAANTTIGYFQIKDTIYSYTGKTSSTFTECSVTLNTVASIQKIEAGSSNDRQPKVEETVYLELPAPLCTYALQTGSYGANLITYSEQIDQWTDSAGATVTANQYTAPDGETTADRVVFDGTSDSYVQEVYSSPVADTVYRFGFWVSLESGTPSADNIVSISIFGDVTSTQTNYIGSNISSTMALYEITATTDSSPSSFTVKFRCDEAITCGVWGGHVEKASLRGPYVRTTTAAIDGALPSNWHLGISRTYINLTEYERHADLWDKYDNTNGLLARFIGEKKQDGKRFIEEQLNLLAGCFNRVQADGALGYRRMAGILAGASYVKELSGDNIVKTGTMLHDMKQVFNQFIIHWNYDVIREGYTRKNLIIDANSISKYEIGNIRTVKFRGFHGTATAVQTLKRQFDAMRDRYSGPPITLSTDLLPSLNGLEVGDVVRVRDKGLQNYLDGQPLDRSFEVQNVRIDWMTGRVSLKCFGSSEAATPVVHTDSTTVISDSWYTSFGTNLTTPLTISGDAVTANGSLSAGDYYYDGDLTIDSGITVTGSGTVRLAIKGHLTINGSIDLKGNGHSGATAPDPPSASNLMVSGTQGIIGNTESGGGFHKPFFFVMAIEGDSVDGVYGSVPLYNINWDGTAVNGLPADLRGSSGSSGHPSHAGGSYSSDNKGGDGGNSGGGLVIISRGLSYGASGEIDTSGGDGSVGGSFIFASKPVHGGTGGGGAAGGFLLVLDGENVTGDLSNFKAIHGDTKTTGTPSLYLGLVNDEVTDVYSWFTGNGDTVWEAEIVYFIGIDVHPTTPNGFTYENISDDLYAKTDTTEPTWPTTIGNEVADGEATWICRVRYDSGGYRGGARIQYIDDLGTSEEDTDEGTINAPSNLTLESGTDQIIEGTDGTLVSQIKVSWDVSTDTRCTGYGVQFRQSDSDFWVSIPTIIGRTTNSTYITGISDGVQHDIRVRTLTEFSNTLVSTWVSIFNYLVIGKTEPPPDIDTFLVERQSDGTREFRWSYTPPVDEWSFAIRYKLGTGHAWSDLADLPGAEGLTSGIRVFETNQLAAGTYTIGIKAIDTSGNSSENAKIIESTLGDPRLAGIIVSENPKTDGWPGTLTDLWIDHGNLYAVDTKTWADLNTDGITWATWTSWARSPDITSVIYEHTEIDIGVITSFTPLVTASTNATTITIEERHKDTGGGGWSSYVAVSGLLTARYVQIRTTLSITSGLIEMTGLLILLSAETVSEIIEDLDTSGLAACVSVPSCSTSGYRIAAGDFRVPITKTYSIIKRVAIALQNTGGGWTWELIDKDVNVGPRIKIYNASPTLADATIDIEIIGL